MRPQIGDIRVRYSYKTTNEATILAQQWNTKDGQTTFRCFNFLNHEAAAHESTEPTPKQLKRNDGCFKRCKGYVGGVAISYIERAESGDDYELEDLLFRKLNKNKRKAWWLRLMWYIWMTFGYYCALLPWTAELARIPIVGGCLLRWHSQTAAIVIFAEMITFNSYCIVSGIIWAKFKPMLSLALACCFACVMVMMFKLGESLPAYYAKYLLGYF